MARDFDDPAEAAWSAARRTPQPAGCFSEPVRLARPLEDFPLTRSYIKASAEPRTQPPSPLWAAADRAKASPAWRYRELHTTHMIPRNRPRHPTPSPSASSATATPTPTATPTGTSTAPPTPASGG